MKKLWAYILFEVWMSYLMTAGLLVFTSGFLLNRVSRPERAECKSCTASEDCNINNIFQDTQHAATICLEPKARVVLLVVDALKYEFATWYNDNASMTSYHRNKLPIIHELLEKKPLYTRLYKFIADPPTTTMQRLQGLTAGSLPTFIDIGSNFASGTIGEDNLIEQTVSKGVIFMGDDTWTNLFPEKFKRQFPSPSFNVWDLDTVDREVRYRIFFEMKKNDWSLLVAHILGIDHCGHKHGSQHPEMTRKLNDTNNLIKEIIDFLDKDTILFVVGDHGMTESGDHGGDSPNETEAAMFVYSTIPLLHQDLIKRTESVNQIDLVPTLASILGIPVPFSNLGSLILNSLPGNQNPKNYSLDQLTYPLHSLWRNIVQTKNYIDVYAADTKSFTKVQLQRLEDMYTFLSSQIDSINNLDEFKHFIENSKHYFKELKDICSEVWVQFDSKLMSKGLILMFCTLFFFYLIINGIPENRMSTILNSSFLNCSMLINLATVMIVISLFYLDIITDLRNTIFVATGAVSILLLLALIIPNWDVISMNFYNYSKFNLLAFLSKIILILTFCGLFSNSYIVEEDNVLSFLLVTLICLLVYNVREKNERKIKTFSKQSEKSNSNTIIVIIVFLACVSIRLSYYFWQCREEHQDRTCFMSASNKIGSFIPQNIERSLLVVTLFVLASYITIVRIWLRNCGNLTGFSLSIIVGQYCPVISGVCIGCYWVLQRLPKLSKMKLSLSWQMNALPNMVYVICLFSIFILYYRPLNVYLLPKKKESINIYQRENIIPQLFEKIKESVCQKETNINETPVVYGLGTVYSAAFISLNTFLTLLYSLLLGDMLSPSTFLMFITCISVLSLSALERYNHATSASDLVNVPTSTILCWFLIAEYFFYGTGHQASFPKIQWDAAFVGTGGHFHGNLLPAILIGINTFGSHIILGAMLPLLVIVPFTLYLIFPNLCKNKLFEDNMKRGELVLYEQESFFHGAIFSASGKYIMFHGIRTFGSMLSATIHCRHLMIWKIFAPKLIFQGLGFLVTLCSVLASLYMVLRIDRQVERLINRIIKHR
ncbi:PREDICTED: GPI ethanolamine phosphate transferase 3 [Polistes canadensis]|uniref:GPI ethanolamine phosphate transferase 3 n=1 Tax=Polistes canadensis TaxID=91411 RepID=UPI000718C7D9|nr:PREDICTED: GPI ethanolamine phosphate transferase 3 [Polistes canadensis]